MAEIENLSHSDFRVIDRAIDEDLSGDKFVQTYLSRNAKQQKTLCRL
jgi:hypothetical protein